jgi:RNA polymerase sigma-70 factor (ECF subfamily)
LTEPAARRQNSFEIVSDGRQPYPAMGKHNPHEAVTEASDADLARRIADPQSANASAEEAELCRRYARRLYLFGRRHLGAKERAHDLAQDALVITLEKLRSGEVRNPDKIGSFILGVARMLSHSTDRDSRRYRPIDATGCPEPAVEMATPDPLPRDHVVRCVEALQDRQRAVVVLTYYAEQTTAGIASSLGLSQSNVRVIRHRAIAQLRACLGLEPEGVAA